MKKQITSLLIILTMSTAAFAEDSGERKTDETNFIPLVKYDYLSLDSQEIQSPGAGLVIKNDDVMFVGLYTRHSFTETPSDNYPDVYHSIDTLLDGKKNRHRYIGIFKSESDKPVAGGLNTFQAAAVYGYEVVHDGNFSLVLGGGLAASDFGIDRPNGEPWPVIPVPLIRMLYSSDLVDSKFEFLTSPNFSFTLGPKSQIRFTGDFRMDQLRDKRDIIFECSLGYRFLPADHEMGDFAGVALGFKNDNYGAFVPAEGDDEALEIHYYSVFGVIDLTILKISAGYAFGGRELYRDDKKNDLGDGYFVSVQGLYQF